MTGSTGSGIGPTDPAQNFAKFLYLSATDFDNILQKRGLILTRPTGLGVGPTGPAQNFANIWNSSANHEKIIGNGYKISRATAGDRTAGRLD